MSKKTSRIKILFKLLIFSLSISTTCISHAQIFSYGFKGGLNLSETLNTYYESHTKTGINAYVFADYNAFEKFSISVQTGFTQKGFKTESFDYYADQIHYYGKLNAELNYIDISVSGKFKFFNGKVVPYIMAGPSLGIKVSDGTTATGNASVFQIADIQSLLDVVYTNSFGIKTGVGVEINVVKNISLILETNYNIDLTSSYNAPDIRLGIETWYYSDNIKNRVLEFSAGVKF